MTVGTETVVYSFYDVQNQNQDQESIERAAFVNTYTKNVDVSSGGNDNTPGGNTGNDNTNPVDAPKTGDDSNMLLWVTLILASGFGIISTVLYGRKKKATK